MRANIQVLKDGSRKCQLYFLNDDELAGFVQTMTCRRIVGTLSSKRYPITVDCRNYNDIKQHLDTREILIFKVQDPSFPLPEMLSIAGRFSITRRTFAW